MTPEVRDRGFARTGLHWGEQYPNRRRFCRTGRDQGGARCAAGLPVNSLVGYLFGAGV